MSIIKVCLCEVTQCLSVSSRMSLAVGVPSCATRKGWLTIRFVHCGCCDDSCLVGRTMDNWRGEFEKWAPDIKVITYRGPKLQRRNVASGLTVPGRFNALITTYEYVRWYSGVEGEI